MHWAPPHPYLQDSAHGHPSQEQCLIKDPNYRAVCKEGAPHMCTHTYRQPMNLTRAREVEGISSRVECSVTGCFPEAENHLYEGDTHLTNLR